MRDSGLLSRRLLCGWVAAVILGGGAGGAVSDGREVFADQTAPALGALIDTASAYVAAYEPRLGAVIAREDYVQRVTGTGPAERRISADLLLVRLGDAEPWLAFRNVLTVDGTPVVDRDERLARLFANPTVAQLRENAQRIVNDSARFNIGGQGNVNVPPFALTFLRPANVGRFRFRGPQAASIHGTAAWRVDYDEVARPTIVRDRDRVTDAPADGAFWLRAADGAVVRSLMHTGDGTYSAQVEVDYCATRGIDLLVPCTMTESMSFNGQRTRGEARYSDVRRFDVTTTTEIRQSPLHP